MDCSSKSTRSGPSPAGKIRHDLTQCQGCWRSRGEVPLKKCGRCMAAIYCSDQCQREHWKYHKEQCRLTEAQKLKCEQNDTMARMNCDLFKWTSKHRPTLAQTVVDGLNLQGRPTAHETELLMVFLSYQPSSPNIKTRFRVESVGTGTYEGLLRLSPNPLFKELPRQRAMMEQEYAERNRGKMGTVFCLLTCLGPQTIHRVVPVSFSKGVFSSPRDEKWMWNLVDNTDTGSVF